MTVGEVARAGGISVRTLHHYDEIGLVAPAGRTPSGYRLYGPAEISRLQEVLFFREVGFGLGEIEQIVATPGYDRVTALRRQRRMLEGKAEHLLALIDAVDTAITAEEAGIAMTGDERLEVFGGFDPSEYEDEARERWGDTDAHRESARRTSRYTADDWRQMQSEAAEIDRAFLDLMEAGVPPNDPAALDAAERHRAHITRWFYECTPEIHAGLGLMYVEDARFTGNIDRAGEGLAAFMSAPIAANAAR